MLCFIDSSWRVEVLIRYAFPTEQADKIENLWEMTRLLNLQLANG